MQALLSDPEMQSSRLGRALGFRPEFISARTRTSSQAMREALMARRGVPPFMPVTLVNGAPAFDGGLVDDVPVEPLTSIGAAGGKTLVLLTRLYRNPPSVPGRIYTQQPSRRIELSQFDITGPDGIRAAYELGVEDGNAFAAALGKVGCTANRHCKPANRRKSPRDGRLREAIQ